MYDPLFLDSSHLPVQLLVPPLVVHLRDWSVFFDQCQAGQAKMQRFLSYVLQYLEVLVQKEYLRLLDSLKVGEEY